MKENISVVDFNLFFEVVKSLSKFATAAKFVIDKNGLVVYSKNDFARCELSSNAIVAKSTINFSILDVSLLVKILTTIKELHTNDFSDLVFALDSPAITFKSKKFKTKLVTCNEELIEKWISKKVTTELTPVFEFTTTSDLIKRLNSHSFIFSDPVSLRIYLKAVTEMENNALYAELGNDANNLNNSVTLKIGLITFGSLENRNIILDFDRLNIFNMVPSNDIKVSLMDKNVLVSNICIKGKDNTFFKLNIYNSIRKN